LTTGFWRRRPGVLMAALAIAFPLAAAQLLHSFGPPARADVERGSEDAFVRDGLHQRELYPDRPPIRWTAAAATLDFRHFSKGPVDIEVVAQGHRSPVRVVAEGVAVATLLPGTSVASVPFRLAQDGTVHLALVVDPFTASDGRRLGTQLRRVQLSQPARGLAPLSLLLSLLVPALVALWAVAKSGGRGLAVAAALAVTAVQTLLLWPCGLLHASYALRLALLLVVGIVALGIVVRWMTRSSLPPTPAPLFALLAAFFVQGVIGTYPLLIPTDASFHANKLAIVAKGDLFPVSETQHHPPYRFPYGVSFYALLAPAQRWLGLDNVSLVRGGAAFAAVLGSAALCWLLLPRGSLEAALATGTLQLIPVTFALWKYGNFSNIFGQAMTVLFFAWWTRRQVGGPVMGVLLVLLACLSHLSSFIVFVALAAALVLLEPKAVWQRKRCVLPLMGGLVLSCAYFLHFRELVLGQMHRFLGSGGEARPPGWLGMAAWRQGQWSLAWWGIPVMVLAAFGMPQWKSGDLLDRSLVAFWAAGLACGLAAIVSPLEVRYQYALTLPLAVAAAEGARRLWTKGRIGRIVAVGLLGAVVAVGLAGIVAAL
jgi:hypothetical protein